MPLDTTFFINFSNNLANIRALKKQRQTLESVACEQNFRHRRSSTAWLR